MKLSDAIRLGAMTGRQAFGAYFMGSDASCALGSAARACNVKRGLASMYAALNTEFPILDVIDRQQCPACCTLRQQETRTALIPHLNDDHRWKRERIADYVETIELAQEPLRAGTVPALSEASVNALCER